jgi:hypothetical protein
MACSNPQNPNCPNCNKDGLAILPARYAVVPTSVSAILPPSLGNKVTDVKLAHHKYALRTLRQGFFYVYYEKHPRGSQYKWEVYGVAPQGTLWRQLAITAIKDVTDEPACARSGDNIPASVIHIEQPEKQGKVWLAFSEHAWSPETFKDFDADANKRDERMQTLEPAKWVKDKAYKHGLDGTKANIEHIIEYQDKFNEASLTGGNAVLKASEENGKHDALRLKKQATRHALHMRKGQSPKVADLMKKIGEVAKGKPHEPMVMAVWDAVGITHELNGFRNDAAGVIEQYGRERELHITAMNAIDGVKKALADKADAGAANMKQQSDAVYQAWYTPQAMAGLRAQAAALTEPARTRSVGYCNDLDFIGKNKLPSRFQASRTQSHRALLDTPNTPLKGQTQDVYDTERTRIMDEARKYQQAMPQLAQRDQDNRRATSWEKYAPKLENNGKTYEDFKANHQAFLRVASTLIDERTDDLIKWLEAAALFNALTEYHAKNKDDGVAFEDAVGDMVFGISSSQKGTTKVDAWIKEAKATKTNLVWRAIASNQEEGIAEINAALGIAIAAPQLLTTSAWGNIGGQIKWNKFADLAKKSVSLYNANLKDGVKRVSTGGLDKLFITLGDALLKPFARVTDTVNEKVIQTILLLRSGTSVQAATLLVEAQARLEPVSRARMIERINTAKLFVSAEESAERAALKSRWAALKPTADVAGVKGFSAIKEARLGVVVAILEGVNLWRLSEQVTPDPKVQLQLLAAKMATSAACLDITASAIKGLSSLSDKATSFQLFKIAGGVLSGGASFIGGTLDWKAAEKLRSEQKYSMMVLYGFRSSTQFLGGAISMVVGLSYAAPLLEKAAIRFAGNIVVNSLSRAAAWALAARAGLMLAGLGFSVATLAISLAIWYFSDDALQDWCEECAFGSKPKDKRFVSSQAQMKAYSAALLEVL